MPTKTQYERLVAIAWIDADDAALAAEVVSLKESGLIINPTLLVTVLVFVNVLCMPSPTQLI
jgi:hypothetical protein